MKNVYAQLTLSLLKLKYLLALSICIIFIHCNDPNQSKVQEVTVIGGGLMGSSTAYQLSQRGYDVLLLEKQDSIYTEGSSYGEARIARSHNRGNDIWSYLHNTSVDLTYYLVDYLNNESATASFKMEDIYTTLPVTYVGKSKIYNQISEALKRQKVESKMALGQKEGLEKFGVILPEDVLLQQEYRKHSGTINPHNLITYLHTAIKKKGSAIRYNSQVTDLNQNEQTGIYEIKVTDKNTNKSELIRSKKIVSAAGPYNGPLLKSIAPYFDTLINPQRVFLAYFKIKADVYDNLSSDQKQKLQQFYPVINSSGGTRETSFFSMIEYFDEQGHPVIKIGGHFQRSPIDDLDQIWKKELTTSEIEWSQSSTHSYFKMLNIPVAYDDIELVDAYSCVYSLTQNEVPYITPTIGDNSSPNTDFMVLGGLSGVGAKGAMSYGMIAANMMEGQSRSDSLYQVIERKMGFDRLKKDVLGE